MAIRVVRLGEPRQAGEGLRLGTVRRLQHQKSSDAEAAERVVWQDTETRFELTRDPKRSVSTIYSRLSDLP